MNRPTYRRRFGVFDFDAKTGELRKADRRIRLAGQPIRILEMLTSRPGDLVTRDELRRELWRDDTFVDFEHNLNSGVKRLRAALGDSAETPRFIETLPRRGYRFLVRVESFESASDRDEEVVAGPVASVATERKSRLPRAALRVAAVGLFVLVATSTAFWLTRVTGASASATVRSIAVLPFVNLSNDPAQEYLSDGLTEALTMELSRVAALRVTSRTSAMRYKKTDKAVPAIAGDLGVDAVIEGSVQREGDRIRVSVQLIRAATDVHLWASRYERTVESVFLLQREIAMEVADAIRVSLAPETHPLAIIPAHVPPRASELYLRGRHLLNRKTQADVTRALEYFESASAMAPDYALAYVGIALAWADQSSWPGYVKPVDGFPRAKAAAERAIALDPTQAEAYATRAFVEDVFERDMEGAERDYRKALALSPSNAIAAQRYALHLRRRGRSDEGLAMARRAHELDPLSLTAGTEYALQLQQAGRIDEAIAQVLRTSELDPNYFDCYVHLSEMYQQKGEAEQALEAARKAVALSEGSVHALHALIGALIRSSKIDDARRTLSDVENRPAQRDAYEIGRLHLRLGDTVEAIAWFDRACAERAPQIAFLGVTMRGQEFDAIRDDPRFQATVRCSQQRLRPTATQ